MSNDMYYVGCNCAYVPGCFACPRHSGQHTNVHPGRGEAGRIRDAVEKAVREEREAVLRYLRHVSSDESWIDAQTALPWIERGDHRK